MDPPPARDLLSIAPSASGDSSAGAADAAAAAASAAAAFGATPSFSVGVGDSSPRTRRSILGGPRRKSRSSSGGSIRGFPSSVTPPASPLQPRSSSPTSASRRRRAAARPSPSPIEAWREDRPREAGAGAAEGGGRPPRPPDLGAGSAHGRDGGGSGGAGPEGAEGAPAAVGDVGGGARPDRRATDPASGAHPPPRPRRRSENDSVDALLSSASRLADAFLSVTSDLDCRIGVSAAARELDAKHLRRLRGRVGPHARTVGRAWDAVREDELARRWAEAAGEAARTARERAVERAAPAAEEWCLAEAWDKARGVVCEVDRRHGMVVRVAGWMDRLASNILGEGEEEEAAAEHAAAEGGERISGGAEERRGRRVCHDDAEGGEQQYLLQEEEPPPRAGVGGFGIRSEQSLEANAGIGLQQINLIAKEEGSDEAPGCDEVEHVTVEGGDGDNDGKAVAGVGGGLSAENGRGDNNEATGESGGGFDVAAGTAEEEDEGAGSFEYLTEAEVQSARGAAAASRT